MDSSAEIINQIFGQSQGGTAKDDQSNFSMIPIGGRNQYVELKRFETDEQFQEWMATQGRKWGIVQKGRVTIEDVIDQYACVFRRRKGYACRVQMRVRHNRRSGLKMVEVLPIAHDHNFYGLAIPSEFLTDDPGTEGTCPPMVNPQNLARSFASSFATSSTSFADTLDGQLREQLKHEDNDDGTFDFASILEQHQNQADAMGGDDCGANGDADEEQRTQQPMEMLWSNILNNPAVQQFASTNGLNSIGGDAMDCGGGGGCDFNGAENGCGDGIEAGLAGNGATTTEADDQLMADQTELLANCLAEKVAAHLAQLFEPKFDSILAALGALAKSLQELKRNQQPLSRTTAPKLLPVGGGPKNCLQKSNNKVVIHSQPPSSSIFRPFFPSSLRQQQQNSAGEPGTKSIAREPQKQQQEAATNVEQQKQQQKPHLTMSNPPLSSSPTTKLNAPVMNSALIPSAQQTLKMASSMASSAPSKKFNSHSPIGHHQHYLPLGAAHQRSPLTLPNRLASLVNNSNSGICSKSARFGLALSRAVNSPMKTSRKSVHAYRQRRRELSYRFMKEVGMMLTINGTSKSIFLWKYLEIAAACQTKRNELAKAGKRVIYRGMDVTDQLYRVDCSKDLVNGRRCGQMIADSLWPRGYFQTRMLMPILKGVSHRAKKRVDGSARRPVATDQFEIFKVALLLLGGFLMDEMDRSKWMETAREGVNQRGLDELANSKRAHYEYEGGPLFANIGEEEEEDDEEEEDAADGGSEEDEAIQNANEREMHKNGKQTNGAESSSSTFNRNVPLQMNFLQNDEDDMTDDAPPPLLYGQEDLHEHEYGEEEQEGHEESGEAGSSSVYDD